VRKGHSGGRSVREPKPRRIPTAYWLLAGGAVFVGAIGFQLVLLGLLGHVWAYAAAAAIVLVYVGVAMTIVVRMTHDDDEWKWF
jgi:membrane protein YdbS with pleckstrin-like domain